MQILVLKHMVHKVIIMLWTVVLNRQSAAIFIGLKAFTTKKNKALDFFKWKSLGTEVPKEFF
jgi:hypothetical protein